MPALAAVLLRVLMSFVFQLLLALGIGFATYEYGVPALGNYIQSSFLQLPQNVVAILGVLRVDIAITLILSAAAAKATAKVGISSLSKMTQ